MSRSRGRASDLEAPWRGVRAVVSSSSTTLAKCAAYSARMPPGQFFSHATAAIIYGIPLPYRVEQDARLHVATMFGDQPPRARGVVGHRLRGSHPIARRQNLPVCTAEQAWLQLATQLPVDDLIVAGDFLLRRKRPISTLEALALAIESGGSRAGITRARAAIRDVRAGTDSPMESRLRILLIRSGLPEPIIGFTVTNRDGDFVGTPDLAYVRERIAIEYQGQIHQSNPQVFAEDVERRELFEAAGWHVILVFKDHLNKRPHWVVTRVSGALSDRASLQPIGQSGAQ